MSDYVHIRGLLRSIHVTLLQRRLRVREPIQLLSSLESASPSRLFCMQSKRTDQFLSTSMLNVPPGSTAQGLVFGSGLDMDSIFVSGL